MVSDDIFRQLKELSRTELKDLCSEMSIFKNELRENKIKDARGILWFKLRNRYNINPNGAKRLKKNPQNEYPKFKKISDTINDIISNYRVGDREINEVEKKTLSYMFYEKDKFSPQYDGEELRIQIEPNIYKNYVAQPFSPLYDGLHQAIKDSTFKFFPNLKKLSYAVSDYGGKLTIFPIKEL